MKVCLLNDSFPPIIDGVANVVMNYAKIMQEEKLAEVVVGTPRYPDTDYSIYPYQVIPYQSFDTTKIVKGYRVGNPLNISEISEMTKFGPDIIHSHCPVASTILARMLRVKCNAPLVFTYHTKFDIDIAKAVKDRFIQKETIKALVNNISACDEVWVVSNGAGANLRSLGYEGDYRVMNNGVDFAKGRVADSEVEKVVASFDLPEGIPIFLYVGRIINYKGLPLILNALAKLDSLGQDFRMIFIGSGPDENTLKEQAQKAGLMGQAEKRPDRCLFVGPVYDRNVLRAWNTRADLFLFPSTYDTNGIVVREAAACGLASVLIKDSCAAEGITSNRNGYIIEEDAESMCSLLSTVCKDLNHVREVGQNAMDEIYISWEDSVHQAHKRYEEVIELKNSGQLSTVPPLAEKFHEISVRLMNETKDIFTLPRRMKNEVSEDLMGFSEVMESVKLSNIKSELLEEFRR